MSAEPEELDLGRRQAARQRHDLRGTAVLRLFLAGCTVAEIATITGHSLRDVQTILDANYFHRDVALARSAIAKLEAARAKK